MKKAEREEGYYWVRYGTNVVETDLAKWIVHSNGTGAWIFAQEGAEPYFRQGSQHFFDTIIPISPRLLPPEE